MKHFLLVLSLSATAFIVFFSLDLPVAFAQSSGKKNFQPKAQKIEKKIPGKEAPTADKNKSRTDSNPDQEEPKAHFDPTNSVRINYGYAPWNKSPSQQDAGSLILREGANGRLVQIHLAESDVTSALFTGLYSISFQSVERLKIEFYTPPQELLDSVNGMKKIASMIGNGQLRRNPFVLRRTPAGAQTIEIFDTREQAQQAIKAYRAEQQVQGLQNAKFPSDQQIDLAKMTEEVKLKAAAAAAAAERVRQEQIEAQKLAALLAKEKALSDAERALKKKEAEQLATEGLVFFRENKFAEATEKFLKAVELDPENRAYYFQFGVALYKTGNANKSLIYLNLADGPLVNQVEKNFFIALNYFSLKEFANAIQSFEKVVAAKSPEMSPAAQFYIGLVQFEEKKWDKARSAFQAVLDTSNDPQLDKKAETYIEQILRLQQFEAERSRKWQFSATLGEQFDSNVTQASDSTLSQGTQSNVEGYRSLLQGSGRYRPVYNETREFAIQTDVLLMYTFDKNFQHNTTLRNADPLVVNLTAPWTRKGLLFGKGHKLDIIPGYETIWMSAEENTNKEIISSFILNTTNMFVINERLYSNYNLELRRDQNKLNSATGDDDSTAIKAKLINSNLHFLWEEKTKILTSEASLTFNQAQGKNVTYNRVDFSVGYIQPFYKETSATCKLAYFYLNYPLKSDNRLDHSYTLTAGLSKKLNDTFSTGLLANYNINNSTTDTYTFKKWTALLTLSALTAF